MLLVLNHNLKDLCMLNKLIILDLRHYQTSCWAKQYIIDEKFSFWLWRQMVKPSTLLMTYKSHPWFDIGRPRSRGWKNFDRSWAIFMDIICVSPLITILLQLLFYLNDSVRLNTFFTLILFAYFAKSVCTVCYIYWPIHFNYAANIV